MAPMNRALRTLTHPAAADEALAAPLARLTREGGKADKRGDLLAVEGSKLRQFSNERVRDYRPDTGNRREQVLFLAPGRRAAHRIVNIGLDARGLTLERLHEPADALLDAGIGPFLALPLGSHHVDDCKPDAPGVYASERLGHGEPGKVVQGKSWTPTGLARCDRPR
jgi:hypothetical protein